MNGDDSSTPASAVQTPERILQRLEWQVIRPLDGLLQGDYRTLFFGTGIDFTDLREYQPEDDIRHIDWNVTARMNSPYVRQYVEDREITAWFLVDLSPSMTFGPPSRTKRLVTIEFISTMARLLTRNGNRVGAILFDNQRLGTIPPRSGRIQVLRVVNELLRHNDSAVGKTTDLSRLLQAALNTFKKRAIVFLISDFISQPGWERPLSLLSERHELLAIRTYDSREDELPDAGFIVVEDSETGAQLFVDTSNTLFRRRYLALTEEKEENLQAALKRTGVDLHTVSTEEDLVKAIIRMAALRKKRRWNRSKV